MPLGVNLILSDFPDGTWEGLQLPVAKEVAMACDYLWQNMNLLNKNNWQLKLIKF